MESSDALESGTKESMNRTLFRVKEAGNWRILRHGRGMYHDVKRRLPYYWSEVTDALTYRAFASTVRMYFVK
jgi:hypothetical protein